MPFRRKLRVFSGCDTCRKRRKKCNEAKPVCSDCERLGLHCTWHLANPSKNANSPQSELPKQSAPVAPGPESHSMSNTSQQLRDYDDVVKSFESAHLLPALNTEFSMALDVHIIVLALSKGWEAVSNSILLDPQWAVLAHIDKEIAVSHQSLVGRMMSLWLVRIATKYFAAAKAGLTTPPDLLPNWLIPIPCQNTIPHPAIFDYCVWPSMRERLTYGQKKYVNSKFFSDAIFLGWRPAFSLEFDETYRQNPSTGLFAFTDSFLSQLYDLRTWRLSKDFLDVYPEFRGDAAQFEASPTIYRPTNRYDPPESPQDYKQRRVKKVKR